MDAKHSKNWIVRSLRRFHRPITMPVPTMDHARSLWQIPTHSTHWCRVVSFGKPQTFLFPWPNHYPTLTDSFIEMQSWWGEIETAAQWHGLWLLANTRDGSARRMPRPLPHGGGIRVQVVDPVAVKESIVDHQQTTEMRSLWCLYVKPFSESLPPHFRFLPNAFLAKRLPRRGCVTRVEYLMASRP